MFGLQPMDNKTLQQRLREAKEELELARVKLIEAERKYQNAHEAMIQRDNPKQYSRGFM